MLAGFRPILPRFGARRPLGALGQESYFSALWAIVSHPFTADEVLTGNPLYSAIGPQLEGGLFSANAVGNLTSDQANALVQQEASNIVQASAGSISLADAQKMATGDVSTVLAQANATPLPGSGIPTWAIIALALAGGLVIYQAIG